MSPTGTFPADVVEAARAALPHDYPRYHRITPGASHARRFLERLLGLKAEQIRELAKRRVRGKP